jgi:hypothetical protein
VRYAERGGDNESDGEQADGAQASEFFHGAAISLFDRNEAGKIGARVSGL